MPNKECPQFDDFLAVPYRKPGKEPNVQQPQISQPAGKKTKKGRQGQMPSASTSNSTNLSSVQQTGHQNPFKNVFSITDGNHEADQETAKASSVEGPEEDPPSSSSKSSKQKFVPLFTAHGNDLQIKLQGRYACQCMCTRHNLISNCINCGRIVCEQEGSGPCFTCGKLVCTLEEADILRKGGLEAEKIRRRLLGSEDLTLDFKQIVKLDKVDASLMKAEAHKDRLLEFDRTAAQRTKIIDDQADYYNENTFLTADQRKAVREKEKEMRAVRFASKLDKNRKFDLDIAGRAFKTEADEISDMYSDPDITSKILASVDSNKFLQRLEAGQTVLPPADVRSFEEELAAIPNLPRPNISFVPSAFRVQDRELQEMKDSGTALSIMQPWASFVVQGLKCHEGRNFYTAHRGKLWITSGSKILSAKEVVEEENLIKALLADDLIVFPEQYLTGFLLGCVDIVDCITQEEYKRQFPGSLLQYPYIFILDNPRELERKFPVSGQSKIFVLDHKIHELAKRQPSKRPVARL